VTERNLPANPGGLVYGTILIATLLAAESPKRETYAKTVAGVALALVVYWVANAYAEYTGHRVSSSTPFELTDFAAAARHELAVIYGALAPLAALLVCWAVGASLGAGVTTAVWVSVTMIVATEIAIGVRTDLTGRELVAQTAIGALLGLMVIALRVLLH
jgi:hypothetical protein